MQVAPGSIARTSRSRASSAMRSPVSNEHQRTRSDAEPREFLRGEEERADRRAAGAVGVGLDRHAGTCGAAAIQQAQHPVDVAQRGAVHVAVVHRRPGLRGGADELLRAVDRCARIGLDQFAHVREGRGVGSGGQPGEGEVLVGVGPRRVTHQHADPQCAGTQLILQQAQPSAAFGGGGGPLPVGCAEQIHRRGEVGDGHPAIECTWLCRSTKPGPTMRPVTSTTSASVGAVSPSPTAATRPWVISRSVIRSVSVFGSMTRPPRSSVSTPPRCHAGGSRSGAARRNRAVLPVLAHNPSRAATAFEWCTRARRQT